MLLDRTQTEAVWSHFHIFHLYLFCINIPCVNLSISWSLLHSDICWIHLMVFGLVLHADLINIVSSSSFMYSVFLIMHLESKGGNTYTSFNYVLLLPLMCTVLSYLYRKSADQKYMLRICVRCIQFVERQSVFKVVGFKKKFKAFHFFFFPDAICTCGICWHLVLLKGSQMTFLCALNY